MSNRLQRPIREGIAAVSVEKVRQAQAKIREDLLARPDPAFWSEVALTYLPWAPTADWAILPEPPANAIRMGAAADVALMVGSTTEETRLFFVADGLIDRITEDLTFFCERKPLRRIMSDRLGRSFSSISRLGPRWNTARIR